LNILSSGDEIIASTGLYGGTIQLFSLLANLGIKVHYISDFSQKNLENIFDTAANADKIKAIFAETISNPSLQILDIKATANFAHSKNIPLIIDNTTATPYLVNPIDLGCDIVIHSSSKYINGSSDAVSGVIIDSCKFKWNFEKYPSLAKFKQFGIYANLVKLRKDTVASIGGCLSPLNAYLNTIGLETLALRIEKICDNAYQLAKFLSQIHGIEVNNPLLDEDSSSRKILVKEQLKGKAGGILTLRAGSKKKAFKIINSLKIATIASNIGDIRTLVIYPATTLYLHNTKEEMNEAGVFDDTIRVSVGIEDIEDLIEDFKQAIELAANTENEN